MVTIAATLHHGDSDSIGPVAAFAIIPSRRHYIHCAKYPLPQTFGPFSQMVKLHLVDHRVRGAITLLLHRYDWGSSASVSVKGVGCASYFEIVMGIPTFSIRPMVVWNRMLRIRKFVRSHTASFTE
jgi:hypothetical protein